MRYSVRIRKIGAGSLLFSVAFHRHIISPVFLSLGRRQLSCCGPAFCFFSWNLKRRKVVALGAHYLLCTLLFSFLFTPRPLFLAFDSWMRMCIIQITYQLLEAGKQAGGPCFEPSANATNHIAFNVFSVVVQLVVTGVAIHVV